MYTDSRRFHTASMTSLKFALRTLCKNLGFSLTVVFTLALAIGANSAIFSVLEPLLLRKLPVTEPDQLVWINSSGTLGAAETSELKTFELYRDQASAFSGVMGFSRVAPYNVTHDGRFGQAQGEFVSGDFFSGLGVNPYAGRLLERSDEGSTPVVVLGFGFWKKEFHSDPSIIGKPIALSYRTGPGSSASVPERSYTVVGVTAPGFFGAEVGESPDVYIPSGSPDLPGSDSLHSADWLTILGRVKPDLTMARAQASLEPLLKQAAARSSIPQVELREFFEQPLLIPAARGISAVREKFSLPARLLMCVVALVLLIACGNVANLLLARGKARSREFSIRLALGAGRKRIVGEVLLESSLLAFGGTIVGLLVGQWTARVLVASLSSRQLPILLNTDMNRRSLLFTAGVLAITTLLCGLAPALAASRSDLEIGLGTTRPVGAGPSSRSFTPKLLLISQVALCTTLLAAAGLLLHTLFNLETFNAGFDRDKVLLVGLSGYQAETRVQGAEFYERLTDRVRELPGVRSVSCSSMVPISGQETGINVIMEGYALAPGESANERFVAVCPGYFQTMGTPLLAGREFTEADVHPESESYQSFSVVMINRSMARRFFGDASPIGKHLRFAQGRWPTLEIIGVVADSKYKDLREGPTEVFYIPSTRGELEIRTGASAKTLAAPLQRIVAALDPSAKVAQIETLRQEVDESLHQDRLVAALCSVFSVLALVLSCVGLYGVLSFNVARRTGEIGLRMALGARSADILTLIIGHGMRLVGAGAVFGAAGAIVVGLIARNLLFGLSPIDTITVVGVVLALGASGLLACYIPARRASRIEPLTALRHE